MRIPGWTRAVLLACLAAPGAHAQTVQLAPFGGYQFGGSFVEPVSGVGLSLKGGLDYGATLDVKLSEHWRLELLYSRQQSEIGDGPEVSSFDLHLERYMIGVVEEKGEGSTKFIGAALGGITRFVPGLSGYGSESEFTLGIGLGVKHFLSKSFGLRAELRGFYTLTETAGGVFCNQGRCLFAFAGQGLWQGDVSGGVILAF